MADGLPVTRTVHGQQSGGMAVVCWSLGNVWGMSMLANEEALDDWKKVLLQRYLRKLVMYGEAANFLQNWSGDMIFTTYFRHATLG